MQEIIVEINDERIDTFLAKTLDISRSKAAKMIEDNVLVKKKKVKNSIKTHIKNVKNISKQSIKNVKKY